MSLFKFKKKPNTDKDTKAKDKESNMDDDCPMCHVPQSVVDQLKNNSKDNEKESSNCCKK